MRELKSLCGAAAVAALMLGASAAQANIIADFELNGSLANSAGTAATLTNNAGGSLGASGITFGLNSGPTVTGIGAQSMYTIDMQFTLDSLNGPRGNGYIKLIDFSNLISDSGFYSHYAQFNAYPLGDSGTTDFVAGQSIRLTFSRDALGTVAAYVNNVQIYTVADPTDASATGITALPLTFFTDDFATAQGEASSGFVDYIRIYDTAITPLQAGPAGVPEPATWAMMLLGFGGLGVAIRRRRAAGLAAV